MASNPAIASRLQSSALVGRVAELGSLASPLIMIKATSRTLFAGICLCAICALFPPRRINTSSFVFVNRQDGILVPYGATHAFLFSTGFDIYRAPDGAVFRAEVDGGRLLAQLVLIGALTGVVIVAPTLSPSDKNEKSPNA